MAVENTTSLNNNATQQCHIKTLYNNATQQRHTTTLHNNATQQRYTTTLHNNATQQRHTTTPLNNATQQRYTTTLYNNATQQSYTTTYCNGVPPITEKQQVTRNKQQVSLSMPRSQRTQTVDLSASPSLFVCVLCARDQVICYWSICSEAHGLRHTGKSFIPSSLLSIVRKQDLP